MRYIYVSTLLLLSCANSFQGKHTADYEVWFGTYMRGHKVGYNSISISKLDDGYVVEERSLLSLKMLGQDKKLITFIRAKTDGSFRVKEFSFNLESDVSMKANGYVRDGKLIVEFEGTNVPRSKRTFKLENDFYLPPVWIAKVLLTGETPKAMDVYDPTNFALGKAFATYEGRKQTEYGGRIVSAHVFKLSMFGADTRAYISEGEVIKVEMPFDIVNIKESMEQATKVEGERLDVLLLFSIKPEGTFDPAKDTLLVLELSNLRGNLVLDFADQKLIRKDSSKAIVLVRKHNIEVLRKKPNLPIPDSIEVFLEADEFAQSDNPRIRELARSIVGDEKDQLRKAQLVMEWVFRNLQKKPTVSIPNALEVLEMGYGDCNEHAILYTALARAVGIPTDIVVGLIYQNGRYFYHAWTASYIKGEWVWIDPVSGQFPADVGHLMLQRGSLEKQSEITGVVGKLKVRIISRNEASDHTFSWGR